MMGVLLGIGSVGLVGTTIWAGATIESGALSVALAFAAGGVASLVRMPSAEERRWTFAPAMIVAISLIGAPGWPASSATLAGVVTAQAILSLLRKRSAASTANILGAAVMFLGLAGARLVVDIPLSNPPRLGWRELGGVTAAALVWFLVESVFEAAGSPNWRTARRYYTRRALVDWPMALVAISSAITLAVLWTHSTGWAIAVAGVPYAIAHHLGSRLARGRQVADLTVRALGRLPEAAGLTASGHTQSVSDLVIAMGKLEGLVGPDLSQLEVAAQLHDIGLLATTTVEVQNEGFSSSDVAEWGADILASSDALRPAAALVRASREPFRIPGSDPDPGCDRRAQLIQVACRVVESVEAGNSIDKAVEALYGESVFQLDPHVISLVRRAARISNSVLDELARRPA